MGLQIKDQALPFIERAEQSPSTVSYQANS